MENKLLHKVILSALLAGLPAQSKANIGDFFTSPAGAGLTAGLAGFAIGGVIFWKVGNSNSTAKYKFKEAAALQAAQESRIEKEALQRATLVQAQAFLEPFAELLAQYSSKDIDELRKDQTFQEKLTNRALSSNGNAERVTHINQIKDTLTHQLATIDDPRRSAEIERLLHQMNLVTQWVNSSGMLHEVERELTIEKCEIIAAQSRANECKLNEEAAQRHAQALASINRFTEGLPAAMHRIEGSVTTIATKGYAEINQHLATHNQLFAESTRENERHRKTNKRVAELMPHLEAVLHRVGQEQGAQLSRIEDRLDRTEGKIDYTQERIRYVLSQLSHEAQEQFAQLIYQLIDRMVRAEENVLHTIQALQQPHTQHPQPSAPMMAQKTMLENDRPELED